MARCWSRIGAIELTQTSRVISLFDWATLAVDKSKALESELSAVTERTGGDKAAIARLESQLADLVKAKARHEDQMLSKFVLLLNNKKAKIRDQQRAMGTAQLSKKKLRDLSGSISPGTSRDTTRTTKKRSAPDEEDGEEDESQAFETQEDRRKNPNDEEKEADSDRQTTPSSTESEPDADDDELPTRGNKTTRRQASPKSTGKSASTPPKIPPARSLPFATKSSHYTRSESQSKAPASPLDDDEETASEDDEL